MIVTARQLRKLCACEAHVDRFVDLFGEEVEVTRDLCIKHAQDFDWDWAAKRLLQAPAWAAYEEATAAAYEAYEKAPTAAAWAAYKEAAWAAYKETAAAAWADAALNKGIPTAE